MNELENIKVRDLTGLLQLMHNEQSLIYGINHILYKDSFDNKKELLFRIVSE